AQERAQRRDQLRPVTAVVLLQRLQQRGAERTLDLRVLQRQQQAERADLRRRRDRRASADRAQVRRLRLEQRPPQIRDLRRRAEPDGDVPTRDPLLGQVALQLARERLERR